MRYRFQASLLLPAFLAALFTGSGQAAAEPVTIKIASMTPPQSVTVRKMIQPWVARITAEVGDAVKVQTFWGGALGRNPTQQLKLVLDGIADMALVVPDYTKGRFPELSAFSLPFLVRTSEEAGVAEHRLHRAGQLSGFNDVKPIFFYGTGSNTIHLNQPIKALEDLAGLKLRASGFGPIEMSKLFGATPVFLPITKAAEAISRGTVAGTIVNLGGFQTFRIDPVTSHHLFGPFGITTLIMAMSEKAYAKFPANVRAAIDRNAVEQVSRDAGRVMDIYDANILKRLDADPKHTVIRPTDAQLTAWEAKTAPLHEAWREKTPGGADALNRLKKTLADIRAGS